MAITAVFTLALVATGVVILAGFRSVADEDRLEIGAGALIAAGCGAWLVIYGLSRSEQDYEVLRDEPRGHHRDSIRP
jgi:hypothetical protein